MPLRHFVNLINKLNGLKGEEYEDAPQNNDFRQYMHPGSPVSTNQLARTEDDPRIQPTDASPRQDAGKASIFFARVQPTVTPEQLLEVFSGFGHVVDLNLFRPFAEAKTSKGCGIVRFSSHAAACLAKEQLHGRKKFSEDSPAMVVEWVNEGKLRVADAAGSSDTVFIPKSQGKLIKSKKQGSSVVAAAGPGTSGGGSSSNNCIANELPGGAQLLPPPSLVSAAPGTASSLAVVATNASWGPATGAGMFPAIELQQQLSQQPGLMAAPFLATSSPCYFDGSATAGNCSSSSSSNSSSRLQQPCQNMPRTPVEVSPRSPVYDRLQQEHVMPIGSTARHIGSTARHSCTAPRSVANLQSSANCVAAQQHRYQHQQPEQLPSIVAGAGAAAGSVVPVVGQPTDLVQAVQTGCLAGSGNPGDRLVRLTGHEAYIPTFRRLAPRDMQMLSLHTSSTQQHVLSPATDNARVAAYGGLVQQDPGSGAATSGGPADGWNFPVAGQMPCTVGGASAGWSPTAIAPMTASMMAAVGAGGPATASNQPVVVAAPGAALVPASSFVLDTSTGSNLAVAAQGSGMLLHRRFTSGTGTAVGQLLPVGMVDRLPLGLQADTLNSRTSPSAGTGWAEQALCAGVSGVGDAPVPGVTLAVGADPTVGMAPGSGSLLQDSLCMQQQQQQQLQQQQQQAVFCAGSSVPSAGGVATAEVWSGPAMMSLAGLPEGGHLPQGNKLLVHCGSGYFDMQASSSARSHPNIAVRSSSSNIAGWTSNSTDALQQRGGLLSLGRSALSESTSGGNTGSFFITQHHQLAPATSPGNSSSHGLLNFRTKSDPAGFNGLPSPAPCAPVGAPSSTSLSGQGLLAAHAAQQLPPFAPAAGASTVPQHAASSNVYMTSSQSHQQRHPQLQQQSDVSGELVRVSLGSGPMFVSLLAENMATVSQLSGALVSIDASLGELMVWLTGTPEQVTAARRAVQLLLDQQQQQQQ